MQNMTSLLVSMTSKHYIKLASVSSQLVIFLHLIELNGDRTSRKSPSARGDFPGFNFSRFQKVVVARRIQRKVLHATRVHQYVIEVPEVDIRLILRQDLLNFG